MAVSLPSDLIADVARAADSSQVQDARAKLMQGRSAVIGGATGATFSINEVKNTRMSPVRAEPDLSPAQKFEAMVLQNFVESMMPKDSENVYGKGFAGDAWKSMMAEQMSKQLARAGGIGIANRLLKDYQLNGDKPEAITGVQDSNQVAQNNKASDVSQTIIDRAQLELARSMNENEGTPSK